MRGACKTALVLALAAALAACADGYPSEDGALILSHDMKLEKAIGAMHHLGHQRHLHYHWHYELLPGCVLEAQAKRFLRNREPVEVALRRSATVVEKDVTTGSHTVRVLPSDDTVGVVVLEGVGEHDALQMKWLLDFLPRHCGT
ncbi:hypothetical protein [Hydrogenophaga laconesensis]|uniref:Lipoprotein n=1 Tax=Hydrogenophaga laconesensis TaxID=1805971 RepID=A0ABU1V7R5_9BURK|nr:hypothetical protein [Hydrogenophaga laconesensis]MDR7093491.1 hypothetical protein [Hydrogenophaga laconesensis]